MMSCVETLQYFRLIEHILFSKGEVHVRYKPNGANTGKLRNPTLSLSTDKITRVGKTFRLTYVKIELGHGMDSLFSVFFFKS